MRVLVTGTCGFLGPHIARRMVADGHTVTGFDLEKANIPSVEDLLGDLRDEAAVAKAVAGQEVVCHLGGIGDIYLAEADPARAASVNVAGTENIVAAARRERIRVVFASTWEVYGVPKYEPIDEDHPCSPHHPYSITKLAAERALFAMSESWDVPVLSLRLATCFGRGLRKNSVFRIFVERARNGSPLEVHGDGSQIRQFVHASDVASAFSAACISSSRGLAINVASRQLLSIGDLAKHVATRYGVGLTFSEKRKLDASPSRLSITRAKEVLGWSPTVSFEDGIEDIIAWLSPEAAAPRVLLQ